MDAAVKGVSLRTETHIKLKERSMLQRSGGMYPNERAILNKRTAIFIGVVSLVFVLGTAQLGVQANIVAQGQTVQTVKEAPKRGTIFTDGKTTYKVTSNTTVEIKKVSNVKRYTVKKFVSYLGSNYSVTSIGKRL